MLTEPYVSAEIAYRQGRMLAEAEAHRLRRQARSANKERRARPRRRRPGGPGSGAGPRLVAAVIQLAPASRRRDRIDSTDQAA
jgi:hypothetical protein